MNTLCRQTSLLRLLVQAPCLQGRARHVCLTAQAHPGVCHSCNCHKEQRAHMATQTKKKVVLKHSCTVKEFARVLEMPVNPVMKLLKHKKYHKDSNVHIDDQLEVCEKLGIEATPGNKNAPKPVDPKEKLSHREKIKHERIPHKPVVGAGTRLHGHNEFRFDHSKHGKLKRKLGPDPFKHDKTDMKHPPQITVDKLKSDISLTEDMLSHLKLVMANLKQPEIGRRSRPGRDTNVIPAEIMAEIEKSKDTVEAEEIVHEIVDFVKLEHERQVTPKKKKIIERVENLMPRPPVVTIMGHVDHGKTTLLDSLRKSRVVDLEHGGITQHIGAFNVKLSSGETVTFLDTPGHAAFSSMRARGAAVTDIVILVVAAGEGIKNQTIESIRHAQKAKVPIIVAINKIDLPNANVENIKNMLAMYDVTLEEFGGDVQAVPISALKGTNLDKLLESIITEAEVLELLADVNSLVEGRVVETRTCQYQGKCATIIVQKGSLKKGDILVAGGTYTKVRNMWDSHGEEVKVATPSTPVEVQGWKELPEVGEGVKQFDTERQAKAAVLDFMEEKQKEKDERTLEEVEALRRQERERYHAFRKLKQEKISKGARKADYTFSLWTTESGETRSEVSSDSQNGSDETTEKVQYTVIIKGDVAGSVEAIQDTLAQFTSDLCDLHILSIGVGPVTDSDVDLAQTFNAEVFAFNVGSSYTRTMDNKDLKIKRHNVIYHMFDDMIESMQSRLPNVMETEVIGKAVVQQPFEYRQKKEVIQVAGCRCIQGILTRKARFKLIRDEEVIYDGPAVSLKHHKEEVKKVDKNMECGLCLDKNLPCQPGDIVECYTQEEVQAEMDWKPDFVQHS